MQETFRSENIRLISVVIPLFNKGDTIARAINSVLAQTHAEIEIIVIDDGSTDQSNIEAGRFTDPRVRVISQANAGVASARNHGAAVAESNYVCFLDADDEWHPEFLDRIACLIESDPAAALYCCRYEMVTPEGHKALGALDLEPDHRGVVPNFFRSYRRSRSLINSSSVCVRKEALNEIGGFPIGEAIGEDVFVWLKLAQQNRVLFDARISTRIYQNAPNRTVDRLPPGIPYFLKAFLRDQNSEPLDPDLRSFLRSYCLIYSAEAVRRGHPHKAAEYRRLLWRTDPVAAVLCQAIGYCPAPVINAAQRIRREKREQIATDNRTSRGLL